MSPAAAPAGRGRRSETCSPSWAPANSKAGSLERGSQTRTVPASSPETTDVAGRNGDDEEEEALLLGRSAATRRVKALPPVAAAPGRRALAFPVATSTDVRFPSASPT